MYFFKILSKNIINLKILICLMMETSWKKNINCSSIWHVVVRVVIFICKTTTFPSLTNYTLRLRKRLAVSILEARETKRYSPAKYSASNVNILFKELPFLVFRFIEKSYIVRIVPKYCSYNVLLRFGLLYYSFN